MNDFHLCYAPMRRSWVEEENIVVKHTPALNEEQITAFLKEAVETVKTEEDPDVLNAYRKIFRKNVPFTLRSYIAAYLIKEFEGSAFPRSKPYSRRPNPRFGDRSRSYFSDRPPVERPMLEPCISPWYYYAAYPKCRHKPRTNRRYPHSRQLLIRAGNEWRCR